MADYRQKQKDLAEVLEVDTSKPHYISIKDKSVHYKEAETANDKMSKNVKETIKKWNQGIQQDGSKNPNKEYIKYKNQLNSLVPGQYLRFINTENKVLNGGFLVKNDTTTKFLFLRGVAGKGFSLQYDNIKDVYYNTLQNARAKMKFEKAQKNKAEKQKLEKKKESLAKIEKKKAEVQKEAEAKAEAKQKAKLKLTDAQVDDILHELYYEKQNFLGRDRLYALANNEGHKISRARVDKWLKSQKLYQLTKQSKGRKTFIPIISNNPFSVCQIDLFTYRGVVILNFIDLFSKYADSIVLPNKSAKSVVDGLKVLVDMVEKQLDFKIAMIQSDNGSEFANATMTKYLKQHDIKQVFSNPYTPTSQGSIERVQRTLKMYLEKLVLQGKSIDTENINKFDDNYNNNYIHASTRMTPMNAMKPENLEQVRKNISKSKAVNVQERDDLEVGNKVRIRIIPELIKSKEATPIKWSEEVYKIHKIKRGKNILKPIKFTLKDEAGNVVKKTFFRNDLQHITKVRNKDEVNVQYEIERFVRRFEKFAVIKNKKTGRKRKGESKGIFIEVKWYNKPASENSVLPANELAKDIGIENYKKLLQEMDEKKKNTEDDE